MSDVTSGSTPEQPPGDKREHPRFQVDGATTSLGKPGFLASLGFGPILFFFLLAWSSQSSWWVLLVAEAIGIGLIILLPTFLMGATLPLTMQVAATYRESAGRTVGTIYSVNTIGAILGSFLGGLVLLPLLTIQYTLVAAALMYAIPGLLLLGYAAQKGRFRMLGLAAVVIGAGVVCAQPWDGKIMSSGVYLLYDPRTIAAAREFRLLDALPNLSKGRELLYYKEGAAATVAVTELDTPKGKDLMLSVGGKPDASSRGDMSTQIGLTLVPELLHAKGPQDVLVIGLGSHGELDTQCELATRRTFITPSDRIKVEGLLDEVGKLTHGLLRSLGPSDESPNPSPYPY